MKSLVRLLENLLQDCGRKSGAPVAKDIETLRRRVEHEGDSFLTITLPTFAADFERSLSEGRVPAKSFLRFKKVRSGIPAFLQGFLWKVFDRDGNLLPNPSLDCIRAVRQICLCCKKVQRPCSKERESAASEAYRECDREVATQLPSGRLGEVWGEVADYVMTSLYFSGDSWKEQFVPRHGPGAVRESILGNQKWIFRRWHMRLEWAGLKYWRYGKATSYPSYSHSNPLPSFVGPEDEEPVKVVFVPKTLKTPRVIAVEPLCMQYVQQGISKLLVRRIENSPVCSSHVNFRDQSVNQRLVREASRHGMLSSLDLSEASDRVSIAHVERLLKTTPQLREWIFACRSKRAQLPNGDIITLRKFASMGSALCFPIESLVFFVSILASMVYRLDLPVSGRLLSSLIEDVYVYGDDLIVPTDMAPTICDDLETLGFKVNRRKSFWTGRFRESCGSDCYDNELVTPVYLRRDMPTDRQDASGIVSCVATARQLFSAGLYRAADFLKKEVERVTGALPVTSDTSPAIGWNWDHSEVPFQPRRRWNKLLFRSEYLGLVPVPVMRADSLDGSEQALAKCFRIIGSPELNDPDHLWRSARDRKSVV